MCKVPFFILLECLEFLSTPFSVRTLLHHILWFLYKEVSLTVWVVSGNSTKRLNKDQESLQIDSKMGRLFRLYVAFKNKIVLLSYECIMSMWSWTRMRANFRETYTLKDKHTWKEKRFSINQSFLGSKLTSFCYLKVHLLNCHLKLQQFSIFSKHRQTLN